VKYQDVRRLLLGLMDDPTKRQVKETPMLSEDEARCLFMKLRDEEDVITARALAEHKDIVMQRFPALIQDFEKIDLDNDSKITWEELKVFIGGTAEWLEHELTGVIGLEELKGQVRSFYRSLMLDQTRRQQGHDVRGPVKAPHMIFQGNPGTGKTSLGRIMARLLYRIGVTTTPDLKEVQRPDLVGEHVGQTGPKTQAVLNEAKKGVLFIDEAYRLTSVESKNDFGREAVETLMAAMNEPAGKAPVMIFAGYIRDMANFMRANEGLYRRIGYTFDFTDYSPGELARIMELFTSAQGFKIDSILLTDDRAALAKLIDEHTVPRARALMNGGLCERLFDGAKQNLDARDDPENPTVVFSRGDLQAACQAIPLPPEPLCAEVAAPTSMPTSKVETPVPLLAAVPPPATVPTPAQEEMLLHQPLSHPSVARGSGSERNLWFHVEEGQGLQLRRASPCCGSRSSFVSVRLDRVEVHRTAILAGSAPSWQETRIVPYGGESLVEFAVFSGPHFAGSATLALKGLDIFDGPLELRIGDKSTGQLRAKLGWQLLMEAPGGDILKACFYGQGT